MHTRLELLSHLIKTLGRSKGILFYFRGISKTEQTTVAIPGIKHPITLRPGTSDGDVFFQVFIYNEFNVDLGFEPRTIIDGGANIGLATIYLKNKFPSASIIAIEPDASNIDALKRNISQYNNIYVKKAGLWPRKTKLQIIDKYNMGKWGLVTEEVNDERVEDKTLNLVDTLSIDDIMAEYNLETIDLLKLDIESAEKYLFSENYEKWLPKTKAIIIELHDWMLEGCSKPFFSAINKTFQNYSLKVSGENVVIINNDFL